MNTAVASGRFTIGGVNHRVTTAADPMGTLVGLVMIFTVVGTILQLRNGAISRFVRYGAVTTCALPASLAIFRIVPNALRLGLRVDSIETQSQLAHSILWGHVFCLVSLLAFCALQIYAVRCTRQGDSRNLSPSGAR